MGGSGSRLAHGNIVLEVQRSRRGSRTTTLVALVVLGGLTSLVNFHVALHHDSAEASPAGIGATASDDASAARAYGSAAVVDAAPANASDAEAWCTRTLHEHHVVPGYTFGTLAQADRPSWNAHGCPEFFRKHKPSGTAARDTGGGSTLPAARPKQAQATHDDDSLLDDPWRSRERALARTPAVKSTPAGGSEAASASVVSPLDRLRRNGRPATIVDRLLSREKTTSGGGAAADSHRATCVALSKQANSTSGGFAWERLGPSEQSRWKAMYCEQLLSGDAPFDAFSYCESLRFKFGVQCDFATAARRATNPCDSGTMQPALVERWRAHGCAAALAAPPPVAVRAPPALCDAAATPPPPLIAVCVASTTRTMAQPAIERLALFRLLLPSLVLTLECGFRYELVLGYDAGDAFYDAEAGRAKVRAWFESHVAAPARASGLGVELALVRVENELRKPGPVFNAMARAAVARGAEYVYRVNDDTQFVNLWARTLTRALAALEPRDVGAAGPACRQGKKSIMTHDFTHRTHMRIFNGSYYPPELSDWYMDDWISRVYGRRRTVRAPGGVEVVHHTGHHGKRYQVDQSHKRLLDGLVEDGKERIASWILAHGGDGGADAVGLAREFLEDQFDGGTSTGTSSSSGRGSAAVRSPKRWF